MLADKDNLTIVTTSEFRLSHPHLLKPSKIKNTDNPPTYSMEMFFDKKTTRMEVLNTALKTAATEKWGPDKAKWPKVLLSPIQDGDKPMGQKQEMRPECAGCWVVKASSNAEYAPPHIVGPDPKIKLTSEAEIYAGCYARAFLKAFAYDKAGKTGVKFVVDGVQKLRDGQPLGGKRAATDMFGVVEGDPVSAPEAEQQENSFM